MNSKLKYDFFPNLQFLPGNTSYLKTLSVHTYGSTVMRKYTNTYGSTHTHIYCQSPLTGGLTPEKMYHVNIFFQKFTYSFVDMPPTWEASKYRFYF